MPESHVIGPDGASRPVPDVHWDMGVCHTCSNYPNDSLGGLRVGAIVREGDPAAVNPCARAPICLPGL